MCVPKEMCWRANPTQPPAPHRRTQHVPRGHPPQMPAHIRFMCDSVHTHPHRLLISSVHMSQPHIRDPNASPGPQETRLKCTNTELWTHRNRTAHASSVCDSQHISNSTNASWQFSMLPAWPWYIHNYSKVYISGACVVVTQMRVYLCAWHAKRLGACCV